MNKNKLEYLYWKILYKSDTFIYLLQFFTGRLITKNMMHVAQALASLYKVYDYRKIIDIFMPRGTVNSSYIERLSNIADNLAQNSLLSESLDLRDNAMYSINKTLIKGYIEFVNTYRAENIDETLGTESIPFYPGLARELEKLLSVRVGAKDDG